MSEVYLAVEDSGIGIDPLVVSTISVSVVITEILDVYVKQS